MKPEDDLLTFLADSPTSFHASATLTKRLRDSNFVELRESDSWDLLPGKGYFVVREDRAVAAFRVTGKPEANWRISVAHTDSPALRLKLRSQKEEGNGLVRIGVEIYGGPIFSTWLDRELAICGRVFVKGAAGIRSLLVKTEPLAVIPNLAIHYNREVNKGVPLDPQKHLSAVVALGSAKNVQQAIAERYGFRADDFLSADLLFAETAAPALLGNAGHFVSGRIDNLTGCHAILRALTEVSLGKNSQLAVFFDHEEVGSSTSTGADSSFFTDLLDRLVSLQGGSRETFHRAKAESFLISVDSAHAVHPNYAELHDPGYSPIMGNGPVVKASARSSYATTAAAHARFLQWSERAQVSVQSYIMRSDLVPGSTVGPMTSSWSGIPAIDVGVPIWGMHSIRETAHWQDQESLIKILREFYSE